MSPTRPPIEPDPFELALCDYLRVPREEVAAGSFEVLESGLVRWQHQVDGGMVERAVKLDPATVEALRRRAVADPGS